MITIVQLKEYLNHCREQRKFFKEQSELKALEDQHKTHVKSLKYYDKEILRMEKKIAKYPL